MSWLGLPADGIVRGTVIVEVRSVTPVQSIAFRLSGPQTIEWNERNAPYFFMGDSAGAPTGWDTTKLPDGAYTLTARGCDSAGVCSELSVPLTIANTPASPTTPTPPVDATAPRVIDLIGAPAGGRISGRVRVEAQTSGSVGAVTFRLEGARSASHVEYGAPFELFSADGWPTNEWPNGSYTVVAEACNVYGVCDTISRTVEVANTGVPASNTTVLLPLIAAQPRPTAPTTPTAPIDPGPTTFKTSYYVDCAAGSDTNSGTAPDRAWKSIKRAGSAALTPGDRLLFKRGCTWQGPFKARWQGTAEQPILIGAYGEGDLPKIQNGIPVVEITGQHQIVEHIEVWASPPAPYPGAQRCTTQPTGWRVGFGFATDSAYNTVRYAKATGQTAGIHFNTGSHHNKALANTLVNNTVISTNTPPSEKFDDDSGAWGVLLNSDYNEVAYNTFSGNSGCSEDYGIEGASIEVYRASNNFIHHNRSINDTTFTELGGTPTDQAENNVYAYNLYAPVTTGGQFFVLRGSLSKWGGNPGTKLYNNTAYMVNIGVSCGYGCDGGTLTMRNNIIWSRARGSSALWSDRAFNESNNIYWQADGNPDVNVEPGDISPTSRVADPQFVDPASYDFRLKSTSPAVDAGVNAEVLGLGVTGDLDNGAVPVRAQIDIGAFEAP